MNRLLPLVLTLLLAGCSLLHPPRPALQELSGVVSRDLTLSGAVLLTGDLLILPGRTLTLLPGTTVQVRSAESSKIDPEYLSSYTEILVRGTLKAEGRADAPITFSPETPGKEGDVAWAGIIFDRTGSGALRYARIEGAEQGVLAIASAPSLRDNLIRGCRYGLVVQGAGSALISNNRIEAGEGGLFVLAGATPDIVGNQISGQAEEGLFVDAASRPRLGRNVISANAVGLLLHAPDLPFDGSAISGNRQDLRIVGGE